jgi:L-iditol 2-dehydrogenase
MKALVMTEYQKFEYLEVDDPKPGEGEVLVESLACGICGSDVHGIDGSTKRRIPPIIMGHEAAGVIAAVGSKAKGWQIGQRVTFDSTVSCGICSYCQAGQVNLCKNRRVLGVSCASYRMNGAMAEFVVVPARILYRLPDEVSFVEGALVEPLSVAVHAVGRIKVKPDSTAIVVGVGTIGLLLVEVLKYRGCAEVVAVDRDAARLKLAAEVGADVTVNIDEQEPRKVVLALTDDRGADYGFEAVGIGKAITAAILTLKRGGELVLIGNISPMAEFPLQEIVTNEIRLVGSCASSGEYDECLDMIRKKGVNLKPLISATPDLAEAGKWMDRLYKGDKNLLKVVLVRSKSK